MSLKVQPLLFELSRVTCSGQKVDSLFFLMKRLRSESQSNFVFLTHLTTFSPLPVARLFMKRCRKMGNLVLKL